MTAFFEMLAKVTMFVLMAVPGYIMVKAGALEAKDSRIFSKLLSYVGMPFLIISSTINITELFTIDFMIGLAITAVLGVAFTFLMFYLTKFFASKKQEEAKRGMMRFCMIFANNGFLGIPLAQALFHDSSALTYLIVLNIINNMMIFALGSFLVTSDKKAVNMKKAILNPVLFGFIAGVLCNVLKRGGLLPQEVETFSLNFRNVVTPVSMFVLGMKMTKVPFKKLLSDSKVYTVSAMRLVIFPMLTMAIMFVLRLLLGEGVIHDDMMFGFFIAFAVPTAGMSAVLADQYNGDGDGAALYTLGTTILSVVALPVLYAILCALL